MTEEKRNNIATNIENIEKIIIKKNYFVKQEAIKRFLDIKFNKIKKRKETDNDYSENWDCLKDIINELNSLTAIELILLTALMSFK